MTITVVPYGPLTERMTTQSLDISLPIRGDALEGVIRSAIPELGDAGFSLAVDEAMIEPEQTIVAASTVALLPAFAGG